MTIEEAAQKLAEMWKRGAAQKEKVLYIHLFAIMYADEITDMSLPEILAKAGLPASYNAELRKGINLAKYVRCCIDDRRLISLKKTLPNYCRSFQEEASKVWCDMSEAACLGLPRYEETITEELLLRLARKHKGHGLAIKAFTKSVESDNGADWAFWFTDISQKGIGVRIQAKRLSVDKGKVHYKSLYYQSKAQKENSKNGCSPTNQCEALLNHGDGLIPIYAFYNSDRLDLHAALSVLSQIPRRKRRCFPLHDPSIWGISVASAEAVKKANWGKDDCPGKFPMIPWHCLVCSCCWEDRPADLSLPSLVGHGLRQLYSYGSGDHDDNPHDSDFNFEPTDKKPEWVNMLQEGSEEETALGEEMDSLNLRGVAIIEETEASDE